MMANVDCLMLEWGLLSAPPRVQACARVVLEELTLEALLILKDVKFEVAVVPRSVVDVWAYFPVHRTRWIAPQVRPKPETRVLLVLSRQDFERGPSRNVAMQSQAPFGACSPLPAQPKVTP
jgi:hypothetical protein